MTPSLALVYLIYGVGGARYSGGLDRLGEMLRELPNVTVRHPTYQWTERARIVADVRRWPDDKIVLIGHSSGANSATFIAETLAPRRIDLLVGYDPTMWMAKTRIGNNVKSVINYRGRRSWIGRGQLHTTGDFRGKMQVVPVFRAHAHIDDLTELHLRTLAEVAALR